MGGYDVGGETGGLSGRGDQDGGAGAQQDVQAALGELQVGGTLAGEGMGGRRSTSVTLRPTAARSPASSSPVGPAPATRTSMGELLVLGLLVMTGLLSQWSSSLRRSAVCGAGHWTEVAYRLGHDRLQTVVVGAPPVDSLAGGALGEDIVCALGAAFDTVAHAVLGG